MLRPAAAGSSSVSAPQRGAPNDHRPRGARCRRESTAHVVLTPRLPLGSSSRGVIVLNVLNLAAVFAYHEEGRENTVGQAFPSIRRRTSRRGSPRPRCSPTRSRARGRRRVCARRTHWARHWAGLAVLFAWLSLDETAEIHERIGKWLRDWLDLHGVLYYAGVIPALLLAVVVAVAYVRFLRALPRRPWWAPSSRAASTCSVRQASKRLPAGGPTGARAARRRCCSRVHRGGEPRTARGHSLYARAASRSLRASAGP